jgi:hypothetical protein
MTWTCRASAPQGDHDHAGIPTVFVNAEDIGYTGTELREQINGDAAALALRSHPRAGALRMGLIKTLGRSRHPPAHAEDRLRRAAQLTRPPAARPL